jgi:hypothetical protein
LSKYVIFFGRKSGEALDTLYNIADIGVGCLGCHRKGLKFSKSLKNREYCSRGIPFFYSETDLEFEESNFVFKVPADESAIDIQQIIEFISNHEFDTLQIRKYAIENLDWEKQYEKVLKELFPNFKVSN